MKILWLTPYPINLIKEELGVNVDVKGHPAGWIVNLSNELASRENIELHIITHTKYADRNLAFIKNHIHFHIIPHRFPFLNKGYPYYLPIDVLFKYKSLVEKIKLVVKKINPDIIHAHGTEGVYALAASYLSDYKSIVSIQGIISEYINIQPTLRNRLQRRIEVESVINNYNFGCRTDWDKNWVTSINPFAKIHYLPEAINPVFFERKWNGYSKSNFLFVGAIIHRKGLEVLLYAFKKIMESNPNSILKIVGHGTNEYVHKIKNIIYNEGLTKNVLLLGYKTPEEVAELLVETTIFVLPTFMDNSPNSLAEAMAIGVPCIVSNVGGIPSMIEDSKTGCLVKPNDMGELVNKMKMLLENSTLQEYLSKNSKQLAEVRNKSANVCNHVINIYNKISQA